MALPTRGLCVTDDGTIADSHWHERRPGVTNNSVAERKRAAEAICRECPVLEMCRTYAGYSKWQGVTVAGWTAPGQTEEYPPWSPDWCIACGRDGIARHGLLCHRCRSRRRRADEERWWSYTDPSMIPA